MFGLKLLLAAIALLFLSPFRLFAQTGMTGTYQNLVVTGTAQFCGTAQVNELQIDGLVDVQGNSAYFGTLSGTSISAASFLYSDGLNGVGAQFMSTLTRPGAVWTWDRLDQIRQSPIGDEAQSFESTGPQWHPGIESRLHCHRPQRGTNLRQRKSGARAAVG